jgi:hypothetical protein
MCRRLNPKKLQSKSQNVRGLHQSEIDDLNHCLTTRLNVYHQVPQFNVAVDDLLLMSRRQCFCNLTSDFER